MLFFSACFQRFFSLFLVYFDLTMIYLDVNYSICLEFSDFHYFLISGRFLTIYLQFFFQTPFVLIVYSFYTLLFNLWYCLTSHLHSYFSIFFIFVFYVMIFIDLFSNLLILYSVRFSLYFSRHIFLCVFWNFNLLICTGFTSLWKFPL